MDENDDLRVLGAVGLVIAVIALVIACATGTLPYIMNAIGLGG